MNATAIIRGLLSDLEAMAAESGRSMNEACECLTCRLMRDARAFLDASTPLSPSEREAAIEALRPLAELDTEGVDARRDIITHEMVPVASGLPAAGRWQILCGDVYAARACIARLKGETQ